EGEGDHRTEAGGGGGDDDRLGAADVVGAALARVRVRGPLDVEVDDDVHVGEPPRQQRVADVGDAPGDAGHVAALPVDGDDLADLFPSGEPGGQHPPRPGRGAGDGDDRGRATPRAKLARCHEAVTTLVYSTLSRLS